MQEEGSLLKKKKKVGEREKREVCFWCVFFDVRMPGKVVKPHDVTSPGGVTRELLVVLSLTVGSEILKKEEKALAFFS